MPKRKIPLISQEIYHIYARSVAGQPIFRNKRECDLFVKILEYYRFIDTPFRFSHFSRLNIKDKNKILDSLYNQDKSLVSIYAFCLMPNHYHLLVKQTVDDGITNFIRLCQNSYARYFNTKIKRHGSVFQSPFKATRIETDEQFLHITRYIHLNPLTSYLLKNFEELLSYPWSSYKDYLSSSPRRFLNTSLLLKFFKTKKELEKFTKDNLDYQRNLQKIKHLTFE